MSRVNILKNEEMVEEEEDFTQDVLKIERAELQTTEAEAVDEPVKQSEEQK